MKISPGQVASVLKSYNKQAQVDKTKEAQGKAGAKKADKTQLSSEAKLFQTAYRGLKSMPDVREEKVSQLQAALTSGNYDVSGEEIANKIIERSLVDKLV